MSLDDIDSGDLLLIEQITARACTLLDHYDKRPHRLAIMLDIAAAHGARRLRLQDMLRASDFDLLHDVIGIGNHLDRRTGELTDCFLPRFAAA